MLYSIYDSDMDVIIPWMDTISMDRHDSPMDGQHSSMDVPDSSMDMIFPWMDMIVHGRTR